jgi:phosphoribosyl 1,2-cyclic phosphodiesterase
MKLTFFSLASGSSGNCYYLGTSTCGILVDAGIDYRKISKILYDYNIEFSTSVHLKSLTLNIYI